MIEFKSFDVYNTILTSIDDIGQEMQNNLNKKEFIANLHLGERLTVSNSNLVKSLITEGCIFPAVIWVNPNSNNGFNAKPGKTRLQLYQAFNKLFDLPLVIVDPYRTSESKNLIRNAFPKAKLTKEDYQFILKYIPKKNKHELIPIFNNLTSKNITDNLNQTYPHREVYRKKYHEAHIPGNPGLKIYKNEDLIYKLGNIDPSISYHIKYSYEGWYAFAEFMEILSHEEILELKVK
jgi:hypothetical protein